MHGFLVIMVLLISIGVSRATGKFDRCFSGWAEADQVTVRCNNTVIAQICDSDSCGNISNPGVLLEKGSNGVCLSINNCSYDSRSCKAVSYINYDQQAPVNFTVQVCNQSTSTSPNPGHNESQSDTIAAWVIVLIIGLLIIGLLIIGLLIIGLLIIYFILYKKKNPKQEPDIEKGEEENFLGSG